MKTLEDYRNDKVFGQCYKGVLATFTKLSFSTKREFSIEEYTSVFIKAEELVNSVLTSPFPEIAIVQVRTKILAMDHFKGEPYVPMTGNSCNWFVSILIEMIFLIALWDKIENKTEDVISAFTECRRHIQHQDLAYIYEDNPIWISVAERIPCTESLTQGELKVDVERLKKENEQLKSKLADAGGEETEEGRYSAGVSFRLLSKLFDKRANKTEANQAALSQMMHKLTGFGQRTFQNYYSDPARLSMSDRAKKEIEEIDTLLKKADIYLNINL